MVKTRSQKAVSAVGNDVLMETKEEQSILTKKHHRKVELLADLVQEERTDVKKTKVKDSNANDDEKDTKKPGSSRPSYVDTSIEATVFNQDASGQQTKREISSDGTVLKPGGHVLSGMGRGGGGTSSPMSRLDNMIGKQFEGKPLDMKFFGVNHLTTNEEICQWPIQALVQILFQIDETTFSIEKANLMKCNPKLLRRLVIEMRNDLRNANKTFTVESNVRNSVGVFSIDTKLWEFEAYDEEELKMILGQYIQIEGLKEEYKQMNLFKSEEFRQILLKIQEYMMDAEIQPFNLHVQFQYYTGNISEGIQLYVNTYCM